MLYNCQDLNLVKKIDNVTKFTELAIMLGITTRTPFEKLNHLLQLLKDIF